MISTLLWVLVCLAAIFAVGFVKSNIHIDGTLTHVDEAEASLKTGDLIFTTSGNTASRIQQMFFGTPINHCCMIVRLHGELWVWDCSPKIGAFICSFREFVAHNWMGRRITPVSPVGFNVPYVTPTSPTFFRYKLLVRRLKGTLNEDKVLAHIQMNLGRPYSYRFWMSAYARAMNLITDFPFPWSMAKDEHGVFCSELLALTYAAAGAMRSHEASVLPVHLWENTVEWSPGFTLMPPEILFGAPHPHITTDEKCVRIERDLWIKGALA